jgi:GT2 family glycosyltransferase
MKKVSVVILNWNGVGMLQKFLPGVIKYSQGEGVEVCVADNGSTDESVVWLQTYCPDVRLIVLDKNYGFADGYNMALQQVEAEYVVLLNSDVEVTPHWLDPLMGYMDAHPEVAACQPKICSERNKALFEYAGASGGYLDKYGYPFCLWKYHAGRKKVFSSLPAIK